MSDGRHLCNRCTPGAHYIGDQQVHRGVSGSRQTMLSLCPATHDATRASNKILTHHGSRLTSTVSVDQHLLLATILTALQPCVHSNTCITATSRFHSALFFVSA